MKFAMKNRPKYFNDINLVQDEIIYLIKKAIIKKKDNFNKIIFSTLNKDKIINSRIVVLRNFYPQKYEIIIHGDKRSRKFKDICINQNVSILFWDQKKQIQIRMNGKALISKQDDVDNEWRKLQNWSKKIYLTEKKPGLISKLPNTGYPEKFIKIAPTTCENELGKKNFGVISISIQNMEWLYLSSQGNRAAFFDIQRKQSQIYVKKSWVTP